MAFASRALGASCLAVAALGGCYRTNTVGEARDVGPVDARALDAPGADAPRPDVGLDDRFDVGVDASACACASDSDCPPPPPSWNCLQPLCTGCACTFRIEPALCGPGASCDALGNCSAVGIDAHVELPDAGPPPDIGPLLDAFVPTPDAFVRDVGTPPSSDALRFARDDQMTVPDRPGLSIGPDLTFEMWARLRSGGILAIKGDRSIGSHLYLEALDPVGDTFRTFWLGWSVRGERVMVVVDRPVPRDVWTHFAIVQRGTSTGRVELQLFVDGEGTGVFDAGDVSSYIASFNSSPLVIGRADIDLDEVRLWRVARSQTAIQAFMRTELDPSSSGLAAYWPLDGIGQVVLDRSLNGNDGFRGISPSEDGADPVWIPDGAF
jgi:hypothetical protein